MSENVLGLIIFALVTLAALLIAGWRGFFRVPQGEQPSAPFWALFFGVVLFFVVVGVMNWLLRPVISAEWSHVVSGVVMAVVLALWAQLSTRGRVWGMGPVGRAFVVGVAAWLIAYPLANTFGIAIELIVQAPHLEQVAVREMKALLGQPLLFWLTAAVAVFVIPVAEEILFRGLLQGWLVRVMHPAWAILLSSLLFAAAHYAPSQGAYNAVIMAQLFPLGLVLGHLYRRQRSLLAPITLHGLFNAITLAALWLIDLYGESV